MEINYFFYVREKSKKERQKRFVFNLIINWLICVYLLVKEYLMVMQTVYHSSYATQYHRLQYAITCPCSIWLLKAVSDVLWNRWCSYSERQVVFDFRVLSNQRLTILTINTCIHWRTCLSKNMQSKHS